MANVLMAWELGEGMGHVGHMLQVAQPLAEAGHRVTFALCQVAEAWPLLKNERFPIVQAPYWNYRPWRCAQPFVAASFADILAVRGWEKVDVLWPLTEAWQNLIDSIQPQLILADYAPTLCLAAYRSLPVIEFGTWFYMPPLSAPTFPALVPGQTPVVPQEQLLAVAQEVQRRRGRTVPATLTGILAATERFPTVFPELDPYQKLRTEPVWDPLDPLPEPTDAKPEQDFFAYLSADNPRVEPVLTQLALTGLRGSAYLRNAPDDMKERLRLQGINVLDQPARLEEALARSAVFVHHAGGTANSALAGGRPQLLFPQHLEQLSTAQCVAQLGVGLVQIASAAPEGVGRALQQLLTERRYADNAMIWAHRLRQRPRRPAVPAILDCCAKYL